MKRFIPLMLILLLVSGLTAQQTGYFTTTVQWVNSDGSQSRSLRVYVPNNYNSANNYALVIGFHGLGSNPTSYTQAISYYGTNPYFGGAIVACPSEGTANTSWFVGMEDFKIISAIINRIKADYNIDTNRMFATGFSFGGKSAYLHGLDEADLIKGIIAHSPGFYSTADVNNTCNDPLHCQHKYNYANAWKVMVCITAGSGEYNLGQTEPYLTLASKAAIKLNNSDGDAIFIEDPNGFHNLPPLSIIQQCWTHVSKPSTGIVSANTLVAMELYPNPATTRLYLSTGMDGFLKRVELFGITGVRVAEVIAAGETVTLETGSLPGGIYLVRVTGVDGVHLFTGKVLLVD
jgi:hypothetical protein